MSAQPKPDANAGRRTVNLAALTPAGGTSAAERLAEARHSSYSAENPTPSTLNLKSQGSVGGSILKLDVTQVQRYDKNPRLFSNDNYDDIAASFEAQGQTQPLPVTQREPGGPYFIAAGGNTRLDFLQRRYESTRDPEHRYAFFYFIPYGSEEKVLAQHLTENFSHGQMKFWESAVGVAELVLLIEQRVGRKLPLRELEIELKEADGVRVGRSMLNRYLFAVNRLGALEGALEGLVSLSVGEVFMPRLNLAAKLGVKFGLNEEEIWASLFNPVLQRAGMAYTAGPEKALSPTEICDSCEVAVADRIGYSMADVRTMLAALKKSDLTALDLKAAIAVEVPPSTGDAGNSNSETQQRPEGTAASRPSSTRPEANRPHHQATTRAHPESQDPGASRSQQTGESSAHPAQPGSQAAENLPDRFHQELSVLCDLAGITDLLVWRDAMPLGFYIDYPETDSTKHTASPISSSDQGALIARTSKSIVFWSLIRVSGQMDPAFADHLDTNSNFYKAMVAENFDNQWMEGLDMGSTMRDEDILLLATKPEYPAIGWLMKVIYTIRELNTKS